MDKNQAIDELLNRGVDSNHSVDTDHLRTQLESSESSGIPLRVKLGIDPTSPNIHLGRSVILLKLRQFQKLGHEAHLIIGDFTALIGDTSDKESERPMLEEKTVKANMETYLQQAFKILDKDKTKTHCNSEWLSKLGFHEIGKLADLFGLQEFISREVIDRRMKTGKRVSLREVLYPLMQGYDSVAIEANVELGGSDQWFNLLAGRTIQPSYNQESQDILTMDLLEGTDKRKMSSSWGNVINITEQPNIMYAKVMSIDDSKNSLVARRYFERATIVPWAEVKKINNELKNRMKVLEHRKRLAREIVTFYHSEKAAIEAESNYSRGLFIKVSEKIKVSEGSDVVVQERAKLKADYEIHWPEQTLTFNGFLELLVKGKLASSKSEARQKITEGSISINGEPIAGENFLHTISKGDLIRLGKKFLRIK